jgi:hypothetical protein
MRCPHYEYINLLSGLDSLCTQDRIGYVYQYAQNAKTACYEGVMTRT